ncbi:MAG: HAMP domain-containing sensor histidine kinase [Nitrososphaeraceae archaeon]
MNNRSEEKYILGKTEVIQDPLTTQTLFINLITSAKHEVLLLLPTINAFFREQRLGIIQLLKQGTIERGVNVKILVPADRVIEKNLGNMTALEGKEGIKRKMDFEFRSMNTSTEEIPVNTVTIVVVDKKESLVFEKKDDSKEDFVDALGLATYSDSKPTVMSYFLIFESLWKQVALYEQLKVHERMQQDFINIAAHELRTPIQSIVGYIELLQQDYKLVNDSDRSTQDSLEALGRNAIRLRNLTNNILDVSRIETGTLKLNKERINLNDKIKNVIKDISNTNLQVGQNGLTIQFLNDKNNDGIEYYVNADKSRVFQVLSNLIDNAVKFSDINGVISISLNKTESLTSDNNNTVQKNEYVFIRIKDDGSGINPEIHSKLFSKFATKSDIGTGLGLFIAKSIIEAHGGKIFFENNRDGKGATFTFTLPSSK